MEELRVKWQERMGDSHLVKVGGSVVEVFSHIRLDCVLQVTVLRKPDSASGLGISLEGTVAVEGGREVRPKHFVRSVLPGGAVDRAGALRSGDELMEVNGRQLRDLFHDEVVALLRTMQTADIVTIVAVSTLAKDNNIRGTIVDNVGVGSSENAFASRVSFNLINADRQDAIGCVRVCTIQNGACAERQTRGGGDTTNSINDLKMNACLQKILSGSLGSLREQRGLLLKSKSEVSLTCCTTSQSISLELCTSTVGASGGCGANDADVCASAPGPPGVTRSRSLEALTCGPVWSAFVQEVLLKKGPNGLGFSILDYQVVAMMPRIRASTVMSPFFFVKDPQNRSETVIVIRSLIPLGEAQQDGRILPGDRLVYVNDVRLDNASLDTAVQALKGAPFGTVRLGIARPVSEEEQVQLIGGRRLVVHMTKEGFFLAPSLLPAFVH